MRLIVCISFTLLSLVFTCNAQTFEWAFSAGAHIDDYNAAVKLDSDGNVYTAGVITGGLIGEQKVYKWAVHLTKFSPNGNIIWTKLIPRTHNMYVRDLFIDDSDHIYLLGSEPGDLVYDNEQLSVNNPADSYILKIDTDGRLLDYALYDFRIHKFKVIEDIIYFTAWTLDAKIYRELSHGAKKKINGSFFAKMTLGEPPTLLFECKNVTNFTIFDTDYKGNFFFVTSVEDENISFGNQQFILPKTSSIVFKSNAEGYVEILADYYSKYEKGATDIVLDQEENIYVAHKTGTDLHIENRIITDIFGCTILKFNAKGKLLFNKPYKGTNASCHLAIDQHNALMVASKGIYMAYIDFYPKEPLRDPSGDFLISKFHPEGHLQWIKGSGGHIADLICDQTGLVFVAGNYNESQISFDGHIVNNQSGNGDADLFLVCLSDSTALYCPSAEPNLIADKANFCEGDSVTLRLEQAFGYDFSWRKDGVLINTNDSTLFTKEEGTYALTINGDKKCAYQTKEISIQQHNLPDVSIVTSDSTILCDNDTLVLSTFKGFGYNFSWAFEDENIEAATDSFTTAQMEGKYFVEVTNKYCAAKDSIELRHVTSPSISIPEDTIELSNYNVALFVNAKNDCSLNWYYNHDLQEFSRTSPLYTNSPGNYLAIAENVCGIDVDNVYVYNLDVSIEDSPYPSASAAVHPNPCRDELFVTFTGLQPQTVKYFIYNTTGKMVQKNEMRLIASNGQFKIDISGLDQGTYILKIFQNDLFFVHKIMVIE
ncbi:MAG: T9SS type A sorting domain-containing protein [Bacteroidales bacterium]|nr:T9SS type A sorting domain-containing protein [Bacteroidales bacterium]